MWDSKMEYFPIFIDINNKKVLVIGEYRILGFKIKKMIEAGAQIIYLTDLKPEELAEHYKTNKVRIINDQFKELYLKDIWLVVCGSNDATLKKKIAQVTAEKNIFCNFVDEAPISSFISPSVISKGDITIAISTKGKSPALNRYLKNEVLNAVGDEYGRFANLLGEVRDKVIKNIPGQQRRSELFDRIVQNSEVQDLIKSHKDGKAKKLMERMIDLEINRSSKN
jgi:siroheme synthase-like protein